MKMMMMMTHLHNLVFLKLIDFACKAAVRESVVNDELVGFKAGFLEQLRT